ncbi:MAG: PEGA domain-containing protein, partial [Archangium sp.]|nr:PEGA domain-containing protein [Archangium sp.]
GQLRGNVMVKTTPSGARVFVNGTFQGYTPVMLQTLPVGKAMIKIERPGFKQIGQMLDISPEDQDLTLELAPSPAFKSYDGSLDKLASEALKDRAGAAMASVAKSLGLERAMIAVLKEINGGAQNELTLAYYDVKAGKRLGIKRATFAGDEYGQLKGEVGRMVNGLVNLSESGGPEKVRSSDPLDGKGGMEDWSSEDRGGRSTARDKKKRSGDPLDGTQGTEDW